MAADPVLSRILGAADGYASWVGSVAAADLLLISHNHYDYFDALTLELAGSAHTGWWFRAGLAGGCVAVASPL